MATGPEHYREAERLVTTVRDSGGAVVGGVVNVLAAAQVHATLALAAATVTTAEARGPGDVPLDWSNAVWDRPADYIPPAVPPL